MRRVRVTLEFELNNNSNGNEITEDGRLEIPPPPPPKQPRVEEDYEEEDDSEEAAEEWFRKETEAWDLRKSEMRVKGESPLFSEQLKEMFRALNNVGYNIERGTNRDIVWIEVTQLTFLYLEYNHEDFVVKKSSDDVFFIDAKDAAVPFGEDRIEDWSDAEGFTAGYSLYIKRPTSLFFRVHPDFELAEFKKGMIFFNLKK